jgi:hypothetical protein
MREGIDVTGSYVGCIRRMAIAGLTAGVMTISAPGGAVSMMVDDDTSSSRSARWEPTEGCTQLGRPRTMRWLVTWLDPDAHPRIVQNR